MHALAHLAAHQRPVRVVELPAAHPLDPAEADSWSIGLAGLRLLHDHFPDFFEQHLSGQVVTPRLLLGATGAFYALADDLCPLQRPTFFAVPSPEVCLTGGEWDPAGALAALAEFDYYIRGPLPHCYGIGVNALLDGHRELRDTRLLTLVLWWLFQRTSWGLGVDLADVIDTGGTEAWAAELVVSLTPLPPDTDVEHLLMCLKLPREWGTSGLVPAEDLIGYAFGRTSEELANVDNYDLDILYGGQVAHDWEDLADLGISAGDAQLIADAYHDLADRLHQQHQTAFKRLARLLHRTNQECKERREQARQHPTPLVAVLAPNDEPLTEEAIANL